MPAAFIISAKTYGAFKKANGDRVMIVGHFMEGCPHCIMLKPTWAELERRFAHGELGQYVYNPAFIPEEMADVQGFPTIRAYLNGKPIAMYNGDRSLEDLSKFVKKYAAVAAKPAAKQAKPAAKQAKPAAKPVAAKPVAAKPAAKQAKPAAKQAKPAAKPAKQ